jgi:two-component system, OmpR family, phosphate regulon sensor histidine kinase PhoR
MNWVWFLAIIALVVAAAMMVWRKWIAPWQKIDSLVREIAGRTGPRTFLIDGGSLPRRVALSLEDLFKRQQELDQQLSERALSTETIFTAMEDGLLVVDSNHRITLVNRTFQQLFGVPESLPATALLEVTRYPEIDQLVAQTLRSGAPQRTELTIPDAKTNSPRHMQLSAVATRNESGQSTGAVVLFHDITQLKQTDDIRRDFVANVSHELRTPLSILHGYIETLLDDPEISEEELSRMLDVMKRHSNRLGALVDDLLSLAQLESTHPNVQCSDVQLSELFAAIVRDWGKRFAEKKLSIDVSLAPDVPVIRADPTRLQEVLYNLLDNAVKYSHSGGKIRLQANRLNDDVVLTVSDTGVGISEADLPRIFERFYRTDKARSRELGGTGLGLSIVKHIAQMHGGTVEAESTFGQGTSIRVTLPLNGAAVTES